MAFDYGNNATQEETQPTQISESSQQQRPADAHLWGYLIPCSAQQRRIDFSRDKHAYKIGRNRDEWIGNDHILTGMKISECMSPCAVWRRAAPRDLACADPAGVLT